MNDEIFDKSSERIARLVNKTWLCRYPRCRYLIPSFVHRFFPSSFFLPLPPVNNGRAFAFVFISPLLAISLISISISHIPLPFFSRLITYAISLGRIKSRKVYPGIARKPFVMMLSGHTHG